MKSSPLFDDFETFHFSSSEYKEFPRLIEIHREKFKKEMKTKAILLVLVSIAFMACKKTEETKPTIESTKTKEERVVKDFFSIEVTANASKKDDFAVYYTTDNTDNYTSEKALWRSISGDNKDEILYYDFSQEIIPTNIITKAPSAELRPDQKDSDSLPDYSVLDQILYQYIEKRANPASIIAMGYSIELVNRTLKMVNTNEYKRNQFCPIIRVSPKAFGVGRRMPIVGKYL